MKLRGCGGAWSLFVTVTAWVFIALAVSAWMGRVIRRLISNTVRREFC